MTAISIAHLGDLHLGLSRYSERTPSGQNQREADFQAAFDAAADQLLRDQPDLVVVAGDIFDRPHVGTAAELGSVRTFRRMVDGGLEVIIVGGNHDQPESDTSLISLGHLIEHGVRVCLKYEAIDVAGIRVHALPYRVLVTSKKREPLTLGDLDFAADRANVLVSHAYARGAGVTYPEDREKAIIPDDWMQDPRLVLGCLGHVHIPTMLHPGWFFSGSLERSRIDEWQQEPGYWMHDITDGQLTGSRQVLVRDLGVEGVPRPMHRASVDAGGKTLEELSLEVETLLGELAPGGSIVDLQIVDVSSEFNKRNLRSSWEVLFRELGGRHLDISARTRIVTEIMDNAVAALPTNTNKAFEEYMGRQNLDDEEREDLTELGLKMLGIAHDKLAQEAVK